MHEYIAVSMIEVGPGWWWWEAHGRACRRCPWLAHLYHDHLLFHLDMRQMYDSQAV